LIDDGTVVMIVIGADTREVSHTVAAVEAATGAVIADRTVRARRRSFEALLRWARGRGGEPVAARAGHQRGRDPHDALAPRSPPALQRPGHVPAVLDRPHGGSTTCAAACTTPGPSQRSRRGR
jgi:hypothetical protein